MKIHFNNLEERVKPCRAQATILTNICLIEDLRNPAWVMQYRSLATIWISYTFQEGMLLRMAKKAFAESVIRMNL